MKLQHVRRFGRDRFESVTHYCAGDGLADKLAAAIRTETGAKVRVKQDSTGFRHVFVEQARLDDAYPIASRREFI